MTADQYKALQDGLRLYWDRVRAGLAESPHEIRRRKKALRAKQEAEDRVLMARAHQLLNEKSVSLTDARLLDAEEIVAAATNYQEACGVYFLVEGAEVVYVGQSVNIYARMVQHRHDGKEFSRFAFVLCEKRHLDVLEALYIHYLKPRLNKTTNGMFHAPMNFRALLGVTALRRGRAK